MAHFYPDLSDPDCKQAICVFYQRYSTNTFPTWERAQPFRQICHNGEINTLQGNENWMRARQSVLQPELFGPDIATCRPPIQEWLDKNMVELAALRTPLDLYQADNHASLAWWQHTGDGAGINFQSSAYTHLR